MLSQANINRALTERALAKTAGAAHMSKHAENWFSADNYNNLKNIGIGAGTAALAGGAAYAASGLIPGLKKKRLARALMALGVGGAAGGAAGYYGNTIQDYFGDKLDNHRARELQAKDKREALRKGTQAATDAINNDPKNLLGPTFPRQFVPNYAALLEAHENANTPKSGLWNSLKNIAGETGNDFKDLYYGSKNMSSAEGQSRKTLQERMGAQKDNRAYNSAVKVKAKDKAKADDAAAIKINAEHNASKDYNASKGQSKTQSFHGYHPSRNLYMNKRAWKVPGSPWLSTDPKGTFEDYARLWKDNKETLKAHFGVGMPDYSTRTDGDTTSIQYGFAEKPTLQQIREFDGSGKGTHTNKHSIKAMQAREEARKSGKQSGNWFTANNNSNLKDIGIGVGTGALTYGATGLIPGLKQKRLARALIALTAGGAAGYYGSDIRGQA